MTNSKTAVITGASGGIGAALALALAAEKWNVAINARREPELNAVRDEALKRGAAGALSVAGDVTRREDVERIAAKTIDHFGGFDVWVNNAGRGITRDILDLTGDDIDQMMRLNVTSAVYGMQVAAKHFLERGAGQVINVSSFLSRVPIASHRGAYSASKAALNSLTSNLRMELATRSPNIHVTLVMPSVVSTDFSRNVIGEQRPPASLAQGVKAQTADEVAAIIVGVIRNPVAEVYTNPASEPMVKAYQADIVAFESRLRR